jgi:hypothetical protein
MIKKMNANRCEQQTTGGGFVCSTGEPGVIHHKGF